MDSFINQLNYRKLTVVMAVYNGSIYIERALDSILSQSFEDFNLLVIDDCSSDDSIDILKTFRDERLVVKKNDKNLGLAGTLNTSLPYLNSKYFSRVDQDDIFEKDHFEDIINFLDENENIALCGTNAITIDKNDQKQRKWYYEHTSKDLYFSAMFTCPFLNPSVIMRTKVFTQNNGYRLGIDGAEDYDLWLRILKHNNGYNLQKPTIKYRVHNENMSNVRKEKIFPILTSIFKYHQQDFVVDTSHLKFHMASETGNWSEMKLSDLEELKLWKSNLLRLNSVRYSEDLPLANSYVKKYYINALLKIITQNSSKKLRLKCFLAASFCSIKMLFILIKRHSQSKHIND